MVVDYHSQRLSKISADITAAFADNPKLADSFGTVDAYLGKIGIPEHLDAQTKFANELAEVIRAYEAILAAPTHKDRRAAVDALRKLRGVESRPMTSFPRR